MTWQDVVGHTEIQERFRKSVAAGKLASTFLFVGPGGVGKRTFARQLAQSLLCQSNPESTLNACGQCSACLQVAADSHPDLELVSKPPDKSAIPLEVFIGDDEHRMQEGLCHRIALKPYCGGRKIAIIDDADFLNQEGANCLLKTLEEPPPKSVIILLGTSEQRQLPTIRSRSQIVRFQPLSRAHVELLLRRHEMAETDEEARELAALSDGSIDLAREYADTSVRAFRQRWLEFLVQSDANGFDFAKELISFVDAAGKDAPARRARLKLVARMAVKFYRALLASRHGPSSQNADPQLERLVAVSSKSPSPPTESLSAMIERCIDLELQVDANANQATVVESWLDDLGQLQLK